MQAVHKHISRSQGESTPHEELLLHKYISKCIPERLHVAKFIAGYEVRNRRAHRQLAFSTPSELQDMLH